MDEELVGGLFLGFLAGAVVSGIFFYEATSSSYNTAIAEQAVEHGHARWNGAGECLIFDKEDSILKPTIHASYVCPESRKP